VKRKKNKKSYIILSSKFISGVDFSFRTFFSLSIKLFLEFCKGKKWNKTNIEEEEIKRMSINKEGITI